MSTNYQINLSFWKVSNPINFNKVNAIYSRYGISSVWNEKVFLPNIYYFILDKLNVCLDFTLMKLSIIDKKIMYNFFDNFI